MQKYKTEPAAVVSQTCTTDEYKTKEVIDHTHNRKKVKTVRKLIKS